MSDMVQVPRELLENLVDSASCYQGGAHIWRKSDIESVGRDIVQARAILDAPQGQAGGAIPWRTYKWLPEGYEGPQPESRWFYIAPSGTFLESSGKPESGVADLGGGYWNEHGQIYIGGWNPVDLRGADWRETLREVY